MRGQNGRGNLCLRVCVCTYAHRSVGTMISSNLCIIEEVGALMMEKKVEGRRDGAIWEKRRPTWPCGRLVKHTLEERQS